MVDDTPSLADQGPLDRIRRQHANSSADPDQGFDAVRQPVGDLLALGVADMAERGLELAVNLDFVEMAVAAQVNLVLARELVVLDHDLLDLGRKYVDAANDEHVVAAPNDLAHAAEGARSWRQQPGEVARAIANDRQPFLGQRGEHQLALAAVGQRCAGDRVDDLGIEVIFPDHWPVLSLDTFAGDPRAHHLAQAIDVDRFQTGLGFDFAPHRLSPWFGAENADTQRTVACVQALARELLNDHLHIARGDHDDVGLEVANQLHLLLGLTARHGHHGTSQSLGAVVRPHTPGE